ncbi:hypothetical protein [Bradyrhizobium sp. SYSU BS000235]|uniref:hypothetical protein n=1 Tax=Bradyrhizobium sp. SYSU BS000235 TaxID=3411332 RepID=UPI003C794F25
MVKKTRSSHRERRTSRAVYEYERKVRLSEEQLAFVKAEAEKSGLSESDFMRRRIEAGHVADQIAAVLHKDREDATLGTLINDVTTRMSLLFVATHDLLRRGKGAAELTDQIFEDELRTFVNSAASNRDEVRQLAELSWKLVARFQTKDDEALFNYKMIIGDLFFLLRSMSRVDGVMSQDLTDVLAAMGPLTVRIALFHEAHRSVEKPR